MRQPSAPKSMIGSSSVSCQEIFCVKHPTVRSVRYCFETDGRGRLLHLLEQRWSTLFARVNLAEMARSVMAFSRGMYDEQSISKVDSRKRDLSAGDLEGPCTGWCRPNLVDIKEGTPAF